MVKLTQSTFEAAIHVTDGSDLFEDFFRRIKLLVELIGEIKGRHVTLICSCIKGIIRHNNNQL